VKQFAHELVQGRTCRRLQRGKSGFAFARGISGPRSAHLNHPGCGEGVRSLTVYPSDV